MVSELTVVVKNEEKRQTTKHLIYDIFTVDEEDPLLKDLIDKAIKQFNGEVDDIRVKISMEMR